MSTPSARRKATLRSGTHEHYTIAWVSGVDYFEGSGDTFSEAVRDLVADVGPARPHQVEELRLALQDALDSSFIHNLYHGDAR